MNSSASENEHLCLEKNRELGHISVATGRIPSLFCDPTFYLFHHLEGLLKIDIRNKKQ